MVLSDDILPEVCFSRPDNVFMILRLIAGVLLVVWLMLVLIGKGGFVHILLLNGIGVAVVDLMTVVRTRMTA